MTLDFGRPILLTDVLIPTCGDLASLSIDIWTLGEEVDGRRLVVATDISTHSLILHDLIPPPVCRFMKVKNPRKWIDMLSMFLKSYEKYTDIWFKSITIFFKIYYSDFYWCNWACIYNFSFQITVIGRYGSTNARAKIPLGFYYGHTYILPWESELKLMHDPLRGEGEYANQPEIDQHLAMMVALQEDIQCRLVENYSRI